MAFTVLDLTGQRFGRLTALARVPPRWSGEATRWSCRCDCGKLKTVQRAALQSGGTQSCGCYKAEWNSRVHTTHGKWQTREYHAWRAMIQRCENPKQKMFEHYGARGITVCPEWRASFVAFLTDMGERPSAQHSLDRVNNSEGYSKANCRWATKKEQANNRRPRRPRRSPKE